MEAVNTDPQSVEHSIKKILSYIGEDPNREGLVETPSRMVKSWATIFSGYQKQVGDVIKTFSDGCCDEMVVLNNIEFYSTCEHHFLPFFGEISIAYIPHKKVIGVSKLARISDIFSNRLQIQERMTTQIAESIMDHVEPKGVAVLCTGQHFCMTSRGVKKQKAKMVTSAIRGVFITNPEAKKEFMSICQMGKQ